MADTKDMRDTVLRLASRYKTDEINRAFADTEEGRSIKTLLVK